jgi:hypothetical protein
MNYNIKLEDIKNINFDSFKSVINEHDFFDRPGKQHYRLLAYLSTLFNNVNIIDIGTHVGESALALSFNKTNIIHSFDIIKKNVRQQPNINFYIENLLEKEVQDKWKDIILGAPFIFLDVDPHNAHMEMEFYNYLKSINYQGFVVCDDIWYFKEMRDNFWYKLPDNEKYDLTQYGHWSGTGIFTFNKNITFNKYDNSDWTLVTAYFNLTKCPDASQEIKNRDDNYYFSHALSTLLLPYNLVIYCDQESLEKIKKIRPEYLKEKTMYCVTEFDEFKFKDNKYLCEYREIINENRRRLPYNFDNRNTASYYLFCMTRYLMLKEVIELNPFNSKYFGWINFCIERMGFRNLIRLDEALSIKREKFSTCYIDYQPEALVRNTNEYFRWGRCGMCSGFFTGNSEYMKKACNLIEDKFIEYTGLGYGHADEQLYSAVYFDNKDIFEHYYGDYQQMITNYVYVYDAPEPPIHNFIKNSYNNKDYVKCFEACEFVWKSYCLDKCDINDDYLSKLYYYYMNCKKRINYTLIY